MIKVRRFKAGDETEIEQALADLPEGSFRQLEKVGEAVGRKTLYIVIFELTEEQAKTWTPTYTPVEKTTRQFVDY